MTEPELEKKPPATLKNFIEDRSKLVTSIAAFIALTATREASLDLTKTRKPPKNSASA
jgi:hypothetical protein